MLLRISLLAFTACLSAACGDVEQCDVGTRGCFAGAPEQGLCKLGLVMKHGTCAEPGEVAPPLSCRCEDGTVCSLDAYRCIDYCEPIEFEPGSVAPPPSISCDAAELSLEVLCRNRCELDCQQRAQFCPEADACAADECRGPEILRGCQQECAEAADPARCVAGLCSDVRGRSCGQVACGSRSPDCSGVMCSNDCPGFNFDGICDDGDLESAASGVCEFGSDCADCGPRRGPSPRRESQGGPCAFHSGCRGADLEDLSEADAWCAQIAPGVSRCVPDCTSEGETCPEGSVCFVLSGVDQDGDGQPDPIEQEGLKASACFPSLCE